MNQRKRISIMLSVILVLQIILPVLTVVMESDITLFSIAVTTVKKWDISKNGDGTVSAVLDNLGTLTISGQGEMRDWASLVT